jgi:flagellar basal-body rod modification protein FlgD
MSTSSVTDSYWITPSTTTDSTSSSSSTSSSTSLDFESLLQLLTTELQYQDPLDPVSNTEYVSQMAQMSSLERLNELVTGMDSTRAYSMLGKEVTYQTTDTTGATSTASGTVESVITKNGTTYLTVDGTLVELGSVLAVSNGTTSE